MPYDNENENTNEDMSVCMEIAAAESIPELHKDAPKAEQCSKHNVDKMTYWSLVNINLSFEYILYVSNDLQHHLLQYYKLLSKTNSYGIRPNSQTHGSMKQIFMEWRCKSL